MKNETLISLNKASNLLGVSKDTLRKWDSEGKFKSIRTQGNHRRYKLSDILYVSESKNMPSFCFFC